MNENEEGRNDWAMLGGVAVGAVIALLVGPPLVGGVAIGLCLGLLFSPKAGRDTRRGIGVWAKNLTAKTKSNVAPAISPANAARAEPAVASRPSPAPKPAAVPERDLHKTSS